MSAHGVDLPIASNPRRCQSRGSIRMCRRASDTSVHNARVRATSRATRVCTTDGARLSGPPSHPSTPYIALRTLRVSLTTETRTLASSTSLASPRLLVDRLRGPQQQQREEIPLETSNHSMTNPRSRRVQDQRRPRVKTTQVSRGTPVEPFTLAALDRPVEPSVASAKSFALRRKPRNLVVHGVCLKG